MRAPAIWMRQITSLNRDVPRIVEGVAIRIGDDRLYGGLIVGEWVGKADAPSFECLSLWPRSLDDHL